MLQASNESIIKLCVHTHSRTNYGNEDIWVLIVPVLNNISLIQITSALHKKRIEFNFHNNFCLTEKNVKAL